MKRATYIAILGLFVSVFGYGQDQAQAFRYSQNYLTGTARYNAMGGAFGAVGADFTAVSSNPAGLGLYRSSEFTITPVYRMQNSKTSFLKQTSNDNVSGMGIANLGLVTSFNRGRNSDIVVNLGFGYNQLNNFNSKVTMSGVNNTSSFLDNLAWYANNSNELDEFYEGLAHNLGLVPLDTTDNVYFNDFETSGYGETQTRIIDRSGKLGEYAFSGALNIENTLYIGGTFGIHALHYDEYIEHVESDLEDRSPYLDSYRFNEYNSTDGVGMAFKLGVIYKPFQSLRLGASFHAPVIYSLTDSKTTQMYSYWDRNSGFNDDNDQVGPFTKDYTLKTPMRVSASAAYIFGRLGLIAAEYEYVDYKTADLTSPGYSFFDENMAISQDFRAVHNLKGGAEIRLNPVYLRAGVQYYMNPFSITSNGSDILVYAGGIGFRAGATSLDLAYSLATRDDVHGLYFYNNDNGNGVVTAKSKLTTTNVMLTLGYKF